jgi:hypothetical protein
MSRRNGRAAAAVLIGLLASGMPLDAASAAPTHRASAAPTTTGASDAGPGLAPDPIAATPAPGTPPATGSAPAPGTATPPPPTGENGGAGQCGLLNLPTTTPSVPTVITCGPVTISFNMTTTTTTVTTVAAPIAAGNGSITTAGRNRRAAAGRCRRDRRTQRGANPNVRTVVLRPQPGGRLVNFRLLFARRPVG